MHEHRERLAQEGQIMLLLTKPLRRVLVFEEPEDLESYAPSENLLVRLYGERYADLHKLDIEEIDIEVPIAII